MDPTYPLVPIANFLGLILVLVSPFAVSRVRDAAHIAIAIYFFAIWVSIVRVNRAVNAIIWRDNANNSAPTWCDVSELNQPSIEEKCQRA